MTTVTYDELMNKIQHLEEGDHIDIWNPSYHECGRIIRVPDLDCTTIVIKDLWFSSVVSAASYITEDECDYSAFYAEVARVLTNYGIPVDDIEIDE